MLILVINMKRYLSIYRCLLILNYHRALIHKADFLNGLFGSIIWGIFSIVAIFILTSRSPSVFGWSREELFVLIGVFNILIGGVFRTLFSRNFDRFTHMIQYGDLDGLLLKPIDSQFALSFWYISYHGIIRIILSLVYTIIVLSLAHIPLTFVSIITFLSLGIFGIMTLYAVWYLVMTIIVWFPDLHNLVEMLFAVDTLSRYPPQVLWAMRVAVFLIFFPITLTVSIPTKALFHTANGMDALLLICTGLGLFYLSQKFWKFALRYYTSASG